jgi:hypothetical protein
MPEEPVGRAYEMVISCDDLRPIRTLWRALVMSKVSAVKSVVTTFVLLIAAGTMAVSAQAADGCGIDLNGDGVVDSVDGEILKAALGTQEGDSDFVAAADVDGDGVISVGDANVFLDCD